MVFDTGFMSLTRRHIEVKEYSVLFASKPNTQEFPFCVMKDYCLGIPDARHQSFSASTQSSQTRHAKPKGRILWAKSRLIFASLL